MSKKSNLYQMSDILVLSMKVLRKILKQFLSILRVEDLSRYGSNMQFKSPPMTRFVWDMSGIRDITFLKKEGLSTWGAYRVCSIRSEV